MNTVAYTLLAIAIPFWIWLLCDYSDVKRGLRSGRYLAVGKPHRGIIHWFFFVMIEAGAAPSVFLRWKENPVYSLAVTLFLLAYVFYMFTRLRRKYGALLKDKFVVFRLSNRHAFRYVNINVCGVKCHGRLLFFQHKTGSVEAFDIRPGEVEVLRKFLDSKGVKLQIEDEINTP